MFLVSLDIGAELQPDVLSIIKVFPGKEVAGTQGLRHSIRGRDGIQPKHGIPNKMNKHDTWDAFERE